MTQDEKSNRIAALQLEILKNPKSVAFCQLADHYLAEENWLEAEAVLTQGLRYNPNSLTGLTLMGKLLKIKGNYPESIDVLSRVISKAPDNWVALENRAESFLGLQKYKQALSDYKQILLYNPQNITVGRKIAKLEVSTADEYEDDLFQPRKLNDLYSGDSNDLKAKKTHTNLTELNPAKLVYSNPKRDRFLSLIDAFTIRNETEKAIELINEALAEWPEFTQDPDMQIRLMRLKSVEQSTHYSGGQAEKIIPKSALQKSKARQKLIDQKKIDTLNALLQRITERKKEQSPAT